MKNQKQRIIEYMDTFGSISSWDAYQDLGVTQLATRIFELKKMGWRFSKERVCATNRFGKATFYDVYRIEERP